MLCSSSPAISQEWFVDVVVNIPTTVIFTYCYRLDPFYRSLIGCRVLVPFGKKKLVAIVINIHQQKLKLKTEIKSVAERIDCKPIVAKHILELCQWASEFYATAYGKVVFSGLPATIRKGVTLQKIEEKLNKRKAKSALATVSKEQAIIELNEEQEFAVDKVCVAINTFKAFFLYGVTGSGKTEVYLKVAQKIIKHGKQVLWLVPEIGLTLQARQRIESALNTRVEIIHSRLNDTERQNAWFKALTIKCKIVLGTRAAVLANMPKLGLVIIDEEQDLSYKEQGGTFLNARDIAIKRAQLESVPVILGSATPSAETWHNCSIKKYELLKLTKRPHNIQLPKWQIVDMNGRYSKSGLSYEAMQMLTASLASNEQVLIYINRRGYAPIYLCADCGWIAKCKQCDKALTLHKQQKLLKCHFCGENSELPSSCGDCGKNNWRDFGFATQKLAQWLSEKYTDKVVLRIDSDSMSRKNDWQNAIDAIEAGEVDIIVGTQILAKGHNFAKLKLVIMLDMDSAWHSVDMRAREWLMQNLVQISGRCGRYAKTRHEVVLQTQLPNNAWLRLLTDGRFVELWGEILAERQANNLPPYSIFSLIRGSGKNNKKLELLMIKMRSELQKHIYQNKIKVWLLGPVSSPMAKLAGVFRWQLLVKCEANLDRKVFNRLWLDWVNQQNRLSGVKLSLDTNPLNFY